MSNILLSVLIPTVVGREAEFERLFYSIKSQLADDITDKVEIMWEKDSKEMTIGEKREKLYHRANGLYSLQVDDDDDIAHGGIRLILDKLESSPTHVGYKERCIINGQYFSSNHSNKYEKWADNFDGFDFVRTIFYKDVIMTNIALVVPFPRIRWNEDEQWSYAVKPLLTKEEYIDSEIYLYQHTSSNFNERYGINNA